MKLTGFQIGSIENFFGQVFCKESDSSMESQWINHLHYQWHKGLINYKEFRSLARMDIQKGYPLYQKYWG